MFEALDIGASALQAQRTRLDTIAVNIAHVNTTEDADGKPNPFRRRLAIFAAGRTKDGLAGVRVKEVQLDTSKEFRKVWDPGHKDAGPDGYVNYPNVDLAEEYVNALEASRAYEANVTMMETTKAMMSASLRLLA
jgi:flagellar basal-body rod protein FlgC